MLDLAKKHGVDTLDSARDYGTSESVIGELTQGDDYWRIVTKLTGGIDPSLGTADQAISAAQESITQSCHALRRDRIDSLLLHRQMHRTIYDGAVWEFLKECRSTGLVGKLGISCATPEEAFSSLEDPDVEIIQVASSLFDQRLHRAGFFESAGKNSKEVFVRSVYLQGVAHLDPSTLPDYLAPLRQSLEDVASAAANLGLGASDLFLLHSRELGASHVVVGCESLAQLASNLDAWDKPAPEGIREIEMAIPEFSANVVNPAHWPAV